MSRKITPIRDFISLLRAIYLILKETVYSTYIIRQKQVLLEVWLRGFAGFHIGFIQSQDFL